MNSNEWKTVAICLMVMVVLQTGFFFLVLKRWKECLEGWMEATDRIRMLTKQIAVLGRRTAAGQAHISSRDAKSRPAEWQ
jgi:hypothetical protein